MEHPDRSLTEDDLDPDPIEQFRRWFSEAQAAGVPMPDAMALATADADGRPSARHVLLRGFDERGFVFHTNYESRKARQLAENPHAAITIAWKELDRQVCARGTVERTSREESEAYFRSRPREARIGAWASRQSHVLPSRQELDDRYAELDARYPGEDVPLPPFWGGFRIAPHAVEFWQGRMFRLHDRFLYERAPTAPNGWRLERLFP
ncbi:MAG: pyridoxamine 5'-phosphate oxidase [Actinobacteria bacterium]|nr:pyridoxamine 5'-phosphate oxidase [Actinomycetota bacterium]